jgi:hypothetical protein
MAKYLSSNGNQEISGGVSWTSLYVTPSAGPCPGYIQRYEIAPPLHQFANPAKSFMLYEYFYHEVFKGNWGAVYNELRDPMLNLNPGVTWHTSPGFFNAACADGHVEFFRVADTYGSSNAWPGHFAARGKYWSMMQR